MERCWSKYTSFSYKRVSSWDNYSIVPVINKTVVLEFAKRAELKSFHYPHTKGD